MVPTKRITDPSFSYTPSHDTNIRMRFERVRREQADADAARASEEAATRARAHPEESAPRIVRRAKA